MKVQYKIISYQDLADALFQKYNLDTPAAYTTVLGRQ